MRGRLLLAASVLVLSGCYDDGERTRAAEASTEISQTAAAVGLKNYAMRNATGTGPIGEVQSGFGGLQSLTCRKAGSRTDGFFFAWYDTMTKVGVDVLPKVAREMGTQYVARWAEGHLMLGGSTMEVPQDCPLPVMDNDWPIVVVPVSIPMVEAESGFKTETKTMPCPAGQKGALIYTRIIEIAKDGRQTPHDWASSEAGKCSDDGAADASITVDHGPDRTGVFAGIEVGAAAALSDMISANLPDTCTRAKITSTGTSKRFNTCDFADTSPVSPVVPIDATPRPLRPPLPVVPCPPATVELPSLSSVSEYAAAMAPWIDVMHNMPARCGVLRITSVAHWPFYQTFNGFMFNGTRTVNHAFTRMYLVKVPMTFEGTAGAWAFTEQHITPYGFATNYRAFPDSWSENGFHWFKADFGPTLATANVYSIYPRGYPDFVGPHTITAQGWLGRRGYGVPVPYPNDAGDPWGDTPTQAAVSALLSYSDYNGERDLSYEGTGTIESMVTP